MSLDHIFDRIKEEYEAALTKRHIYNPLAYALYVVWKEADGDKSNIRKPDNKPICPKIWLDPKTAPPVDEGYIWCKSVNEAYDTILIQEGNHEPVILINMTYSAGQYHSDGGHYINLIKDLGEDNEHYAFQLHDMSAYYKKKVKQMLEEYNMQLYVERTRRTKDE